MEKFNIYGDEFSKVYDRFWNDFIDKVGPKISKIYQKYSSTNAAKNVLDLCCGTGQLIKILSKQGYQVTGIDRSASMLKIADTKLKEEINASRVTLLKDNMEDFNLNTTFDLIVSTFDSINHLEDLNQVNTCFRNVYNHLVNNGVFIFDINSEDVLKKWNFIDLEESEDKSAIYVMHGKYELGESKAYTRMIGFIDENLDGNYKRFDEIMYNSLFDISDILKILEDVGFKECILYSEDIEKILEKDGNHNERVFIVAIKKSQI